MRYIATAVSVAILLASAACQDTPLPTAPQVPLPPQSNEVHTGWVYGPGGQPIEVKYVIIDGLSIHEGDINLGPVGTVPTTLDELLGRPTGEARLGVVASSSLLRWPSSIPYVISSSFSSGQQQVILSAMSYVTSSVGGVSFYPRTSQNDYIKFQPDTNCSSPVGKGSGERIIRLTSGCINTMGKVVHEIGHALGMWHEQSRCDRDSFVHVDTTRALQAHRHNFDKKCNGATDVFEYNEASIMHYAPGDFSDPTYNLPPITSLRNLDTLMGQRDSLTWTDINTINYMYAPGTPLPNVTFPGGIATVSWTNSRGAVSFSIDCVVVYEEYDDYSNTSTVYDAGACGSGSTSSAPFAITDLGEYTGAVRCYTYWSINGSISYSYWWDISVTYPYPVASPSQSVRMGAPIAPTQDGFWC